MKIRYAPCLAALLLSVVTAATLSAADAQSGKLMKERLEAKKAAEGINTEMQKTTASLAVEANGLSQLGYTLQQPPMTDDKVAELKKSMDSVQTQLLYCQGQLVSLQMQIDAAEIKDPAARAAKRTEIVAKAKEVDKKLQEAQAPFRKQLSEVMAPVQKSDRDFIQMLDKCFRDSSGKFGEIPRQMPTWFGVSFNGQVHWKDADNDAAWVALSLLAAPSPTQANDDAAQVIDGKYHYNCSGNSVWMEVGYFNVTLCATKKEWQGDVTAMGALVKNLIDLDALAALKPE